MYHKGKHKFKHLDLVPGGTFTGFGTEYPGQKVFYVDKDGDDDNDGLSVNTPLKLIETAIGKCTANKYDAIVVMQESPGTATTGESWPVDIDKQGILLTGLYSRGLISDSGFGPGASDATDCIYIAANHCAVENLYLQVSAGGSAKSVITTDAAAVYGATIRNCWIGLQNTATYGFYTGASSDWPYLLIENCTFGAPNASSFTNAIKLFNATFGMIRNNVIYGGNGYAIYLLGSCGNVGIFDNKIVCYSDTDGYAIHTAAGSSDNAISGNEAMFGSNDMTNQLYQEASTADYNNWGINYEDITASLPTA